MIDYFSQKDTPDDAYVFSTTCMKIAGSRAEHSFFGSLASRAGDLGVLPALSKFYLPYQTSDLCILRVPQKLDLSDTKEFGISKNVLLKCTCQQGR